RIALLRGRIAHKTGTVDEALAALAESKRLADISGDRLSIFLATAEYAHVQAKQDLERGLEGLRFAESLFQQEESLRRSTNPVLVQGVIHVELQLGVNSFDAGDFGEAERRLVACVARLRELRLTEELPVGLNYLGQLYLAMGA